jgi:hypothetical protein
LVQLVVVVVVCGQIGLNFVRGPDHCVVVKKGRND